MNTEPKAQATKNLKRIGLLGGSFNPIHLAHIRICETILGRFPIEKCILVPAFQSPLKNARDLAPVQDRLAMIKSAAEEFKDLHIEYSTWELDQEKVSYTINTLRHFNEMGYNPLFIVGADSFRDIAAWKEYRELFSEGDFAVVSRPSHTSLSPEELIPPTVRFRFTKEDSEYGNDVLQLRHESGRHLYFVPMTPFPISSSELRARLRQGKDCTQLIPESVLNYIYTHKLYSE